MDQAPGKNVILNGFLVDSISNPFRNVDFDSGKNLTQTVLTIDETFFRKNMFFEKTYATRPFHVLDSL